jgi:hypothetical protein
MNNVTTNLNTCLATSGTDNSHSVIWTNNDIIELRLAMIVNALEDIRDGRKSKEMQQEAKNWFMSNDTQSPFSVVNCCLAIGLDIHRLRYLMNLLTNGGLQL